MTNLNEFIKANQTVDLEDIEDKDLVKEIQSLLNKVGNNLTVDGIVGANTIAAFAKFKKDNYLEHPTALGRSTARVLLQSPVIVPLYHRPTNGIGWLSSPFGRRARGYHKGIDIAASKGTEVYAIASGRVTALATGCVDGNFKCGGGYGNVIYLSHLAELSFDETRYAHLSRLAAGIHVGKLVEKGDLLGYVGNTGHSFGDHLHFEIRRLGQAINPLAIIYPIV